MKTFLVIFLSLFSFCAYAEVAVVEPVLPEWVGQIVVFLTNIPTVGPILVVILKWLAIITSVLTVVSAALQGVAAALVASGEFVGAKKFAAFVAKWSSKILPFLKFFSAFNVKK